MASQDDFEELKKTIESLKNPVELILDSIGEMFDRAEDLNKSFINGRTRMDEMADAITRSAAGVIRLGGSASDAAAQMAQIAEGSRRNVIATEEQVSKLYAAEKLLGINSKTLVENFANVGIEASQIGTNLESSIEYIQSVGLNAKTVMEDVSYNMDMMNQFNFSDGVQGLTKMAAQASMLKFDMSRTAEFADKVMSPEGAIEAAAGFQRLGVNIGGLIDPFKLMNDSINDPGALQDSIIKATKQYTEFDEKTKSFKINPQGILTLKELATVTGISAKELSKTALAAADLDRRISAISPSLQFEKEEDKQLLANMATMRDGEYVVQIKDDKTGLVEQKKLTDITKEEFDKLKEIQENRPKTLEDIGISQLGVLENISLSLKGGAAKGSFGVAGTPVIRENLMGADRIMTSLTNTIDKSIPKSAEITKGVTESIEKMKSLFIEKDSGKITQEDFSKKLKVLEDGILKQGSNLKDKGLEMFKNLFEDGSKKITGNSGIEKEFRKLADEMNSVLSGTKSNTGTVDGKKTAEKLEPLSRDNYFGIRKSETTQSASKTSTMKSQIDFGGTITFKVDAPAGVSQQWLTKYFESPAFKEMIYKYYEDKAKELERK
jgi:hypothetical protein